jgi:predicted DNA-binding protein YlxM (UPF0122 family)
MYTTTCKEKNFTGGVFMTGIETGTSKLNELVYLSMLYDFYGELFSDHKKRIFEDYILNDLSLSEIADELSISRQGVHDIVKRCTQELKEYEDKLSLVKRFSSIKDKLSYLKELSKEIEKTGDIGRIQEIEILADDILKEL